MATSYEPVRKHWFYKKTADSKVTWLPFSRLDSNALEENFLSTETDSKIVHTDGGRFDVDVVARTRTPVYWSGKTEEIRRCSWFYKTIDSGFTPYDEAIADLIEEEYKLGMVEGTWQRKITLPDDETIAFHSSTVMVHFFNSQESSIWKNSAASSKRPRVLRRGIDEFDIEEGENVPINHLVFLVHGIGAVCDLKMRTVEEVVDDFRSIANQLIQSHYKTSYTSGQVGRIEVLPISWHNELHSEDSGVDDKLKAITLGSISRLRSYTNDTILDVLFYTSPVFCQSIINIVGESLNRIYTQFCDRNPNYTGSVSLGGHSLGSLILFDLLCHQNDERHHETQVESSEQFVRPRKKRIGAGQPTVVYPQLVFRPMSFYALGSPIGMFVTTRGIDELGLDFELPTCQSFYNIFHPYDPVAYRIEPLVNPYLANLPPVVIPHHKGRKRIHLELKETISQVRGNLKQKFTDTIRDTVETITHLVFPKAYVPRIKDVEHHHSHEHHETSATQSNVSSDHDSNDGDYINNGVLNKSNRIDYVLQEAPLEYFNEYLFALTSHVCYWESEDTILFIVKDIYTTHGIETDKGKPQHTMNIERDILTNRVTAQNFESFVNCPK